MNITGLDIRQTAHHLAQSGINTGERRLRRHLLESGALRKTLFGYEATKTVRERGLIINQMRQHQIKTESGLAISRPYTVPIITADGIAWVREQLTTPTNHGTKPHAMDANR